MDVLSCPIAFGSLWCSCLQLVLNNQHRWIDKCDPSAHSLDLYLMVAGCCLHRLGKDQWGQFALSCFDDWEQAKSSHFQCGFLGCQRLIHPASKCLFLPWFQQPGFPHHILSILSIRQDLWNDQLEQGGHKALISTCTDQTRQLKLTIR